MRREVLNQIDNNPITNQVYLGNLQINDDEIEEIMQKIKSLSPNMSLLNLDGNNLSNEGAIILTNCLHDFGQLNKLSLQFNHIGREGAISLFSLKKTLSKLSIFFHGNKISNVREMDEIEHLAKK